MMDSGNQTFTADQTGELIMNYNNDENEEDIAIYRQFFGRESDTDNEQQSPVADEIVLRLIEKNSLFDVACP